MKAKRQRDRGEGTEANGSEDCTKRERESGRVGVDMGLAGSASCLFYLFMSL